MPPAVVCLGDPITDLVARVDKASLDVLGLVEGGSIAISSVENKALIKSIEDIGNIHRHVLSSSESFLSLITHLSISLLINIA